MKDNTKIALVSVGVTLGLAALFFYSFRSRSTKNQPICADFIKDGFVYNSDGTQGYAKKAGEWAGCGIKSYDSEYYDAVNSVGLPIRLKRADVKIRKISV